MQTNLNIYFNKHLEKIKRQENNKKRKQYLIDNHLLIRPSFIDDSFELKNGQELLNDFYIQQHYNDFELRALNSIIEEKGGIISTP